MHPGNMYTLRLTAAMYLTIIGSIFLWSLFRSSDTLTSGPRNNAVLL